MISILHTYMLHLCCKEIISIISTREAVNYIVHRASTGEISTTTCIRIVWLEELVSPHLPSLDHGERLMGKGDAKLGSSVAKIFEDLEGSVERTEVFITRDFDRKDPGWNSDVSDPRARESPRLVQN